MNDPAAVTESEWDASDFVSGALCLDLTNTVGGRTKARDVERLTSFATAVAWSRAAKGINAEEAMALLRVAAERQTEAMRCLQEIRALRETLHGLFSAWAAGNPPQVSDEEQLRGIIAKAVAIARLVRDQDRCVWSVPVEATGLKTILVWCALSAMQLLVSKELIHLRECERCSWLFLDRSKNQRRRWCRTDACGNRARAASHYQRTKDKPLQA